MTREEYLQLVKSSEAFKALDAFYQEKILKAEGKDMEAYAKIFQHESSRLFAAQKDMMEKDAAEMKNFTGEVKVMKKDKLKSDENFSTKKDLTAAEALLEQLKQI